MSISRANSATPSLTSLRGEALVATVRAHPGGLVFALYLLVAIVIERNVLEWRFDLGGEHALTDIDGYDQPIIVACSEGYASSFAAASLRALGFTWVADLAGGYWAWRTWREAAEARTEQPRSA